MTTRDIGAGMQWDPNPHRKPLQVPDFDFERLGTIDATGCVVGHIERCGNRIGVRLVYDVRCADELEAIAALLRKLEGEHATTP